MLWRHVLRSRPSRAFVVRGQRRHRARLPPSVLPLWAPSTSCRPSAQHVLLRPHRLLRPKPWQLLAEELFRAAEASQLGALRLKANEITLVDGACVEALHNLLGSSSCRLNSLLLGSNTLKDEGAPCTDFPM